MNKIMLGAIIAAAFIAGTIATGTIAYAKPPSGQQEVNQFEIIFDLIEDLQMQIDDLNDDGEPITINCPPGSVQTGIIMDGGGITELICETHIEGPVLGFYRLQLDEDVDSDDLLQGFKIMETTCDSGDIAVETGYSLISSSDSAKIDRIFNVARTSQVVFTDIVDGDSFTVLSTCADFAPAR